MDAYVNFFRRLLGLRLKRHIDGKEVIIQDPHYANDAAELQRLSDEVTDYAHGHKLMHLPNIIKVFFKYEPDHEIERISDEMEAVIEDLSNTRDKLILTEINHYPILSVKAHTRPFEHRWMNIAAFILLPIGIFLYIRMWSFRLRLLRDLRTIKQTNTNIVNRINEVYINKV
jgi:lipopolysaccharide export system permease protein